jgi:transcriptional regulator with XRE-family HTH domain
MNPSPRKQFSINLKRVREQHGLSQSELSRRSGISVSALCRLEASEREPRLGTIVRLARVFGDMDQLLRGLR